MSIPGRSICHDSAHYVKTFQIYAELSSKFHVLANWGDTVFTKIVVEALKENCSPAEGELRVLGIGSGSGEMDCRMLKHLLKVYPKIHNTVVEPAPDHMTMYKALAAKSHLEGVTWDWRTLTFDDFRDERKVDGDEAKFHFISSIHSIYYAKNPEDMLMYLYDHLEENGLMLVIIVSDESGFWRLWNKYSPNDSLMLCLNSADIRNYLDKRQIPYEMYKQPSRVNITCCTEPGNPDGLLVADFLCQMIDVHKTKFSDEIMAYLKGEECSTQEDGQLLFNNDWDAVIIRKVSK